MNIKQSIRVVMLSSLGTVAVLAGVAESAGEAGAAVPLDLVVLGANGAVREVLTEGAIVRGTADLRLRAPAGSDVLLTIAGRGAGIVTANGTAPLVPQRSMLAGAVPPGPVEVRAEVRVGGAVVATHSWHLTVLGDAGVRSSARSAQASSASAPLRASAAAARGAPSLQFAQRVASRRGGADEMPRGAREAALFRQWAPGVVLVDTPTGLGSGAIVSRADRLIVTNYHVVAGNDVVQIAFKPRGEAAAANAQTFRGDVIRYDQVADLALVRVSELPDWAPEMKLGTLTGLEPGVDVHAIGHPTGELWSYTQGIVSQVRRNYSWRANDGGLEHLATVIQTQTPINPGNSGGPLIDDNGAIVGINSFGRAETQGLNFAVSVEQIRSLLSAAASRNARRAEGGDSKGGGKDGDEAPGKGGKGGTPGGKGEFPDPSGGGKGGRGPNSGSMPDKPPGGPSGDHAGRRNVMIYLDTNGDGRIDTVFSDRDGNGQSDMRVVDENGDGKPDVWYLDENGDGQADIVGRDTNGDGEPDVWRTING